MKKRTLSAPINSVSKRQRPAAATTSELRSGKWSQQEEEFAERIISAFLHGNLPDCKEGTTLRSYMAEKLGCLRMRISKKFAGRCIGKAIYVKKMSSSGCARPDKSNETAVPIVSIPKFIEGKESWKSESNSSPVSVASGVECLMESPLPSQVSMDDWMELLHLLNHDECLKLEEKMEESLFMPIDKLE